VLGVFVMEGGWGAARERKGVHRGGDLGGGGGKLLWGVGVVGGARGWGGVRETGGQRVGGGVGGGGGCRLGGAGGWVGGE